jgi:hypothetical protein
MDSVSTIGRKASTSSSQRCRRVDDQWRDLFAGFEDEDSGDGERVPSTETLFRVLWPVIREDMRRDRLRKIAWRSVLAAILVGGGIGWVVSIGWIALAWHLPVSVAAWYLLVHRPEAQRRTGTCELCKLDL